MTSSKTWIFVCSLAIACGAIGFANFAEQPAKPEPSAPMPTHQSAVKAMQAGNFKDAYDAFRKRALDAKADAKTLVADFTSAVQCLQNLARTDEIDAFREEVIKLHAGDWRLVFAAAENYQQIDHFGYLVAGKFERGQHRGGGDAKNSTLRDRVRALQLMDQASALVAKETDRAAASNFYIQFAQMLQGNGYGYPDAWRLQLLTDLKTLPDYDDGWYYGGEVRGAPVDAAGKPVLYATPKSWADAKSDGERFRWCLTQAVEAHPPALNHTRWVWASFLYQQFGEQTLAQYAWALGRDGDDDTKKNDSGTFALHTLKDGETIARLADGVKRFELADEYNFIKICYQIVDDPKSGYVDSAFDLLAQIYQNRRQYPRAVEILRRAIKENGDPNRSRSEQIKQIEGAWGRFEPLLQQPAGKGATLEYRFRNGKSVEFTAHAIKVRELLTDVKTYLKSKPQNLDWNKLQIQDFGYRLVQENETKYVGEKVAGWILALEPRAAHVDKRVTVTTPLQKAGAYLLTAKMQNGNTTKIIVWLDDTAIVKKPLDQAMYYFVADAVTGEPIHKLNLEFFGYRQRHIGPGNKFEIDIKNSAEFTDADGQVVRAAKGNEQDGEYQWLITAVKDGRFAYLGFTGVWYNAGYDQEYEQTKVFTITDRPVYRPGNKVDYKFWVRHAKYDQDDTSSFANKPFTVEIHNPKGEKVLSKAFTADAYGGFDGSFELPNDTALGVYQLNVAHLGGGTFRVEEYKKPEFEVTVEAPTEPIMLGEKVSATIKAKYYFGAPVANGKVTYKIQRTGKTKHWHPPGPWDWFYGPGYWWFAYDYTWYPGWGDWGCFRPHPFWWPERHQPPELVAEREVPLPADGILKIEIDTAAAKELHPDLDHEYTITAEVVDESRRTIVGTGNVLVARKPFKVYAWVDRGHYRVGDTIKANFSAQTIADKPIKGTGKVVLYKIAYKDAKPIETIAGEWKLDTDEDGRADLQIKAGEAGQFRLSYTLTDAQKHTIEGAYVLTIVGDGFDGSEFRFNDLELIPDKQQYAPGDTVKLQVNANRANSTVLLFARATNGVYLKPKVLRLTGKSQLDDITIVKRDMPNFFVEAVTISSGKLHTETKELVVPPEKRVLNVAVEPSAKSYKPGQKAKVKLRLTDSQGENFVGSTVLAIYDKSVEYISGGSNVPEIKEFFWKWRRHHHPQTESSLQRGFYNLDLPNKSAMNNLGLFGESVVEELGTDRFGDMDNMTRFGGMGGGFGGGGGGMAFGFARGAGGPMGGMAAPMAEAAPAPAMDMAMPMSKSVTTGLAMAQQPAQTPPPNLVEPSVRSKFADTALWVGSLTTAKDGTAEVELTMPENLTAWKVKVWGMGHGTKVGQGDAEVVTAKDVIVRLQAPRFFVETDEVVLSANVHNYLKTAKDVVVKLDLDDINKAGDGIAGTSNAGTSCLALMDGVQAERTIKIPAGGEERVDWRVKVVREGEALVRMSARTDEDSDAMEQKFPVYVHGILKTESFSGMLRLNETAGKLDFTVPAERRVEQSRIEVRYSPTLAGACVDALPYLVEYPYGCTEQTLNRFVPTVVTQKILQRMGLDLKAIETKRTNLNAQELGDPKKRAAGWKRFDRNPVFDNAEVTKMVKSGVERLTEMQCSDGGWGWFSGYGEHSAPHTTAVVVHGLQTAKSNDVALVPGTLERGIEWLKRYKAEQVRLLKLGDQVRDKKGAWEKITNYRLQADNLDALVAYVLSDADHKNAAMTDYLYRDRTHLAVYAKALFGLALHAQGDKEKLDMILKNIAQFVVVDDENQTAYLKLPQNDWWWSWYGSEIEAHSFYLKLLAKTEPQGDVAPKLVKYLLNNRRHGTYWNSTRDTAYAIEALADYLKASGEDKPDLNIEVWLDGKKHKEVKVTAADLFTMDNTFTLEGKDVTSGKHALELKKSGKGPLYYNAYVTNFTLEDRITRAGLEVKVNRKFYKLVKADKTVAVAGSRGQAVEQKVEKYDRVELADLSELKSGELLEVELEIDSKNDYEYVLFEDLKAAGCEAVDVRSGYTANSMNAYVEFRDNRVGFFIRALARGKHSVSYRLRAEIPGRFSALPAQAQAMYAPELKANSDEFKLKITD